jgi:putative ABC transport system permease protein
MSRFYRALLHLYPAGYRAEYGDELAATFAAQLRGHTALGAFLIGVPTALADVVPNAMAVHWDVLRQDLRYSTRSLLRTPGFALTAVLLVALGVGANTAAFSLADYVLVRPLPYPRSDRLVDVWERTPGYSRMELSPANYADWKKMSTSFEGFAAYTDFEVNLVGTAEPRRIETGWVTPDFFDVMQVGAFAGRTFSAADSLDSHLLVLSYGLWQSQFGGAARVIGSTVRLDDEPYTVIGIMPSWFSFPTRDLEAWRPLIMRGDDPNWTDRGNNFITGIARLKPGVSLEQAGREMDVIAARLEQQFPRELKDTGARVVELRSEISERSRLLVLALCGAALCILILACANLASLLLARASHRARELAVRAALGAGRDRLVRQLVTESVALAAVGGAIGVAVAVGTVPLLARLVPPTLPLPGEPTVDFRVLAVAAVLVALTGLGFGVAPALGVGRARGLDALRDGARAAGGRTQRVRATLVIAEVASSVLLLISSGLLVKAVLQLQAIDPGFRPDHVLTLRTALPYPRYALTSTREQYYARVLESARSLPGVTSAAYATGLPMSTRGMIWPATLNGEDVIREKRNSASVRFVTPQYFGTMGIRLRDGRDVTPSDTRSSPLVAVVSESFAKRLWPNERAIGKRFKIQLSERTVVGVAADVRVRGLEMPSEPQVYLASAQLEDSAFFPYAPKDLVVRSTAPMASLLPAIRTIVHAADPEQPISGVRAMSDIVDAETASRVTQLRLLGVLSLVALLIAGVGIHGLLTFTVARRTQEIGVRRALGEQVGSVVRRVLREATWLALAGTVIGVAVAYASARAMSALLAGVRPGDPVTVSVAAALCFITAMVGALRPALRAARVDPIMALRGDT